MQDLIRKIVLPQQGKDEKSATLLNWFVQEGDYVNKGDAVAEIENLKAVVELESKYTGTIKEIVVEAGERNVKAHTTIAIIELDNDRSFHTSKQVELEEAQRHRDHEIQIEAMRLKAAEANLEAARLAVEAASKAQGQASNSLDELIKSIDENVKNND